MIKFLLPVIIQIYNYVIGVILNANFHNQDVDNAAFHYV